ncbi:MAG: DNA-binding protein [Bacteroidaceae bacterium]|nr:DNA-binding protein [Bacteroidaceae bacterium]MBQ9499462.1 DNA-binding protein [Bacteroidaceae bacterium]
MSIKVIAKQTMQTIGNYAGTYRYVLQAQLYNKLAESKVIREAALRSGIAQGTINASWAAIGEVIKAWATEGHSVAIPGLGTMRFGVRAATVADVSEVSTGLIKTRKVIFTPNVDIKDELKSTSINITCYDKDGNVVKQVTSDDTGTVEDNDNDNGETSENVNGNGTEGGGTDNTGGNTENQGSDDNGGGNPDGGIG